MRILTKKKPILIGIIAANIFLIAVALAVLFLPQETAPYTLLAEAETRIEKNLCRLAILEQDPADEVIWRQLLLEYQQHADPLTLYAAQQQAEKTLGHTIVLPEGITAVPAISAPLQEGSDIAQKGVTLKAFDQADGIVSDGTVTYLSVQDGVYAHYKGLTLKIFPSKVQKMIPAEEGLYFLNVMERKVQYITGDGSYITTLSSMETLDFTFCRDAFYQLDTEGRLYRDGILLETPLLQELCTVDDTLYGLGENGVCTLDEAGNTALILPSSPTKLTAGEDGCLYYLNEYQYPCRWDPEKLEAVILEEIKAIAIGQTKNKVYILDFKGKLRKI